MYKAIIFDMFETLVTQYSDDLYFGEDIAADLKIEENQFMPMWKKSKEARSTGKIRFEDFIKIMMKEYDVYSEKKLTEIIEKRTRFEERAFSNIHKDIRCMLTIIKNKGIKLGLISNCFSEEVEIIQKCDFFELFDAVCLSFLEKCQKPDDKIFEICLRKLQVEASECIYIGDSEGELRKSKELGMKCFQPLWYIGNHPENESRRCPEFDFLSVPLEIVEYV